MMTGSKGALKSGIFRFFLNCWFQADGFFLGMFFKGQYKFQDVIFV